MRTSACDCSICCAAWRTRPTPASLRRRWPDSPVAASAAHRTLRQLRVVVLVVPVPPVVRRALRIALRRVLPRLLPPEGGQIQVAPGAAEPLVAAVVGEIGAVYLVAVADERVRAMPLVD